MSGAAAITASGDTMRSLARPCCRPRSGKMSAPPAMSISSETQPIPLISGSSHFLEPDARTRAAVRPGRDRGQLRVQIHRQHASAFSPAPTSAPTIRIIARMPAMSRWLKACTATPRPDQLGGDRRLEIGKGEDQIRIEREDLRDVRRREGRDTGLFAPHPRRAGRHSRTRRRSGPVRRAGKAVSTVSSVRQTIRSGGKRRSRDEAWTIRASCMTSTSHPLARHHHHGFVGLVRPCGRSRYSGCPVRSGGFSAEAASRPILLAVARCPRYTTGDPPPAPARRDRVRSGGDSAWIVPLHPRDVAGGRRGPMRTHP